MNLLPAKELWTSVQQEIWRTVETYTNLILQGDVKHFLEYFHEEYTGWNYHDIFPVNKSHIKNELSNFYKYEVESYKLVPLVINNINEIAIVHYLYSITYKKKDGKKTNKYGRNTDILLHYESRWMLIGDHVGHALNKDNNNYKD